MDTQSPSESAPAQAAERKAGGFGYVIVLAGCVRLDLVRIKSVRKRGRFNANRSSERSKTLVFVPTWLMPPARPNRIADSCRNCNASHHRTRLENLSAINIPECTVFTHTHTGFCRGIQLCEYSMYALIYNIHSACFGNHALLLLHF